MVSLAVLSLVGSKKTSAAPGEATNVLAQQIVSYVSGSCNLNPLTCGNSYHSPQSHALLYVPQGTGGASVTFSHTVANRAITSFTLQPLSNAPGYVCGGPVASHGALGGGSVTLNMTNNPVQNGNIRTIRNYATNQVYNVYCVIVTTGPPYNSITNPSGENVGFNLTTNGGSFLGVFSGPQTSQGTGYFGGNGGSYNNGNPPGPNWWYHNSAFSNPCNTDGSNNFNGTAEMTLFDLDTYALASRQTNIRVAKTLKPGIASAPDGGVAGAVYNVGLTGVLYGTNSNRLTQLGGNVYRVLQLNTGESLTVRIAGESYTSQYIYTLYIDNIGSANKIRVRLPYDQINSVMRCVDNRPPNISLSAVCTRNTSGFPRLTVSVTTSDPDGNPVTLINTNNGVGNTFTGSQSWDLSAAYFSFSGTARATARDSRGATSPPATYGYTCPANRLPVVNSVSGVCSGETAPVNRELRISVNGVRDPDGGTVALQIRATGPPYNNALVINTSGTNITANYSSPGNYASPVRNAQSSATRAANTYSVTFSARDAQTGAWQPIGSATYYCYRNPATGSCSIATNSIEPGAVFHPRVTANTSPALSGSINYRLTNSGGSNVAGTPQNTPAIANVNGTYTVPAHFSAVTVPTAGRYYQRATVNLTRQIPDDPASLPPCEGVSTPGVPLDVAQKPYFKVVGGDVITFYPATQIRGWNQALAGITYTAGTVVPCAASAANGRCGSAVQGSILSANTVASANSGVKSGSTYVGPKFHTLANVGSGAAGSTWGGGFGTPSGMLPPVFSTTGATALPATWTGYANVPASLRRTYVATGNLYITGNVTYASGSFGSVATIPRIRVIATGNIYIAPGVSQLDGEYIAGGTIYTCGNPSWGDVPNATTNIYNTGCNSTLTVNGSLVGSAVKLTRLAGTLRAATDDEMRWNGSSYPNRANIAEVINFTPEIYLSNPGGTIDFPAGSRYDSIIALPPVL